MIGKLIVCLLVLQGIKAKSFIIETKDASKNNYEVEEEGLNIFIYLTHLKAYHLNIVIM